MTDFIFDGHNDTLLKLQEMKEKEHAFFNQSAEGHFDLVRARKGGFMGGFFAIFCPAVSGLPKLANHPGNKGYSLPLPGPSDYDYCHRLTNQMIADLFKLERESEGGFRVVRSVEEMMDCKERGVVSAILHLEGAEAIDPELNALQVYYQAGLRSLGLVWSRPNDFGEGVPFRFPSSPDTGPGLTENGKRLVEECNRLGIMLDTSHLNEKGFWDVARISTAPLVATHSNAHALCPMARNLTDAQLDAIGESSGVVGVTYSLNMLQEDGTIDKTVPLREITKHIHYIADRIGIDHVALGSDFDGTSVPDALKDVTGVPKLLNVLRQEGMNEKNIQKLTHGNWVRVLSETWITS